MDAKANLLERPRLRDSIVVQRDSDELLFISTASRRVKRFAVSDAVLRLLPLLDGRRTVDELARLVFDSSVGGQTELRKILQVMQQEKLLSSNPDLAASAEALGGERAAFYDRQLRLFQDFCDEGMASVDDGVALQERLGRATVLVCGIGGLGGWVAQSLAASGVGSLRLCDFDTVERSNLTRQVLFAASDVGRPKVNAAADRISAINPHTTVTGFNRRIGSAGDLADLAGGCDLVVGCADQPDIATFSGLVSDACLPAIPHIIGGGYAYHIGILGITVLPGRSACWECARAETSTDHGRDRAVPFITNRAAGGATSALAGMVGNALAWEAVRVLLGLPPAYTNRWTEIDYWPMQIRSRPIPRRPECRHCGAASI